MVGIGVNDHKKLFDPRWKETLLKALPPTRIPNKMMSGKTLASMLETPSEERLVVSILGPPNAGKSTLFNRLMCKELNRAYRLSTEKRKKVKSGYKAGKKRSSQARIGNPNPSKMGGIAGGAIVSSVPGTTRDRRECIGRIGGTLFTLVDTAGVDGERIYRGNKPDSHEEYHLDRSMMQQTLAAAQSSDLILLLFDARVGVTADLAETATWLRKLDQFEKKTAKDATPSSDNKDNHVSDTHNNSEVLRPLRKIVVLANKLEGDRWVSDPQSAAMDHLVEASRVGFGEAIPISAEHGEGMTDIATIIQDLTQKKKHLRQQVQKAAATTEDEDHDSEEDDSDDEDDQSKGDDESEYDSDDSEEDSDEDSEDKEDWDDGNDEDEDSDSGELQGLKKGVVTPYNEKPLQLAILGRQNVGKSTLVNALLQRDRVITGPTPGLTRDAIAVEWSWQGRQVQIVDTAGIRRALKRDTSGDIEEMAVRDAIRAMRVADVAVLVLDAGAGVLQRQELAIADAVVREGRSLVVAANKMDLLIDNDDGDDDDEEVEEVEFEGRIHDEPEEEHQTYTPEDFARDVREQLEIRFPMLRRTPVVAMSSLTGESVEKLLPVAFRARDRWSRVISTGLLNRWLSQITRDQPPPTHSAPGGRRATKIKYIMQTKGRPPTFLLFCNVAELPTSYLRFLTRHFQDTFEMFGMEVRLAVKKSAENPYASPSRKKSSSRGVGGREGRKKRLISQLKTTGKVEKKGKSRRKKRHIYR